MDLSGQTVIHKRYGTGVISRHNEATVTVDFQGEEKRFVYPQAFNGYLRPVGPAFCAYMDRILHNESMTVSTAATQPEKRHVVHPELAEQSRRERYESFISSAYSVSVEPWKEEEEWNDENEEEWF